MTDSVRDMAMSWAANDPEPAYRKQVEELLAAAASADLEELFEGRIGFGTAGLRAAMGPGPNRMNQMVVDQTTRGLLLWMARQGSDAPVIVVGFDARHHSADYAQAAAAVVAAAGGTAIMTDTPVPTPVLALAILDHQASAGIMITASHNPPADNGYKLYLGDGIQIIPPADRQISDAIDEVAAGAEAPSFGPPTTPQIIPAARWIEAHRAAIMPLLPGPEREVTVVYTAMHGVGGSAFMAAAIMAGFPRPIAVPEQFDPDPDFPTADFPNPEEPGALDLALALARKSGADAVVAHDPDADRLAIAVPGLDGEWGRLSGDQVGVLLAEHLIRHHLEAAEQRLAPVGGVAVVAKSLVSSQQMEAVAAANGVVCRTTLTGFKWVARAIIEEPDSPYLLGYEEALGYCVGGVVRDKDGISAALVAMQMLAGLKAQGRTVWDVLADLDQRHGAYRTRSFSVRLDDSAGADSAGGPTTEAILQSVLDTPPSTPGATTSVVDLSKGEHYAPTPGVVVHYENGTRLIVRPSGTEPKVKFYLEAIGKGLSGPAYAENELRQLADELTSRFGT